MTANVRIQDLIDIPGLQVLLDGFQRCSGVPSALADLDGTVLTRSAGQDPCVAFHAERPELHLECRRCVAEMEAGLGRGGKRAQSTCPLGLTTAALPLFIEGRHFGNIFTGRVALRRPNRGLWRKEADRLGLPVEPWLAAAAQVPVVSQERLDQVLAFLLTLVEAQALRGLAQVRGQRSRESLRVSEEHSEAILGSTRDGFWRADAGGRILQVNDAYCEMIGYSREALLGMTIAEVEAEESAAEVLAHIQRIQAGRVSRFETRHRRRDGSLLPLELCVQVMPGGNQVFAFMRDITERRRAEAEKAELQAQLVQAQKMESLGNLAGGIAHDMNNVLGAVLGLASANLAAHPEGSPAFEAFQTITRAAERGGKLVKGLLHFARSSPAEERILDLNGILREEAQLLERTTLAQVRLVLELEPDLRPVRGDGNALVHAIMNLCVNAVDAMAGHGILTLRTRNAEPGWVEVSVDDTGCGMPKEVLARAMDPFFTTKGVDKGTGLGLALVYGTIKTHRGRMSIQSEPGQGTQVLLRLPTCETVEPAPAPAEPGSGPVHRALEVVLVDDDELIRTTLATLLGLLGHHARLFTCGEEALEALEDHQVPDVVILDMNMPGLGGGGTLPRLRARHPAVPVLLATGRVDDAALDLVHRFQGVTLLAKPFTMLEIRECLQTVSRPIPD